MNIRQAVRSLARDPGASVTAVLTLAIGAAACVTVFTAADATMLRPFPFANGDRIVLIADRLTKLSIPEIGVSPVHYDEYRNQPGIFAESAAVALGEFMWNGERVPGIRIGAGLLPLLRVAPLIGRNFTEDEMRPGNDNVLMLSYAMWQQRFAGAHDVIGRAIRVDGHPYTVVAVLPENFSFRIAPVPAPAMYAPASFDVAGPPGPRLRIVARLADGVTFEQAAARMAEVAKRIGPRHRLYDGEKGTSLGYTIGVAALRDRIFGSLQRSVKLFTVAVALVLLIACVNVANLLTARYQRRARDLAVRQAMGASQGQLVRGLLAEAFLIAASAMLLGLLLATWLVYLVVRFGPAELLEARLDWRTAAFAAVLSMLVTAGCGLLPAWRITHADLSRVLAGGRTATRRWRSLRVLVAVEAALAILLTTGAAVMLKSFHALQQVDLGFERGSLLTAQLSVPGERYRTPTQCAAFFQRVQEALQNTPGVASATMASALPSMFSASGSPISIEGRGFARGQVGHSLLIEPGWPQVFGVRLVSGRAISETDTADKPRVAVVNQTLARQFFPDGNAIGQRIVMGGPRENAPWMEIVGVVNDLKTAGPANPTMPQVYAPFVQNAHPVYGMVVAVRGEVTAASIRSAAARVDPDAAVYDVRTMDERVSLSTARPRMQAGLLGVFAGLAVLLAVTGIGGVVAYVVAQRVREIGVRVALGATRRQVLWLMIRDGMTPVLAGTAAGILGAIILSDSLEGLLFQTKALDPLAFGAAIAAFLASALAGSALAARGAAAVDPIAALRIE